MLRLNTLTLRSTVTVKISKGKHYLNYKTKQMNLDTVSH